MRGVKSLPPVVIVKWAGHDYKLNIWFYGQDDMECRFCKEIVKKGHTCDKAPPKKCFSCGQWGHMKWECKVGDSCFVCGEKGHISRDCPKSIKSKSHQPNAWANTVGKATACRNEESAKLFSIFDKNKYQQRSTATPQSALKVVNPYQLNAPNLMDNATFPNLEAAMQQKTTSKGNYMTESSPSPNTRTFSGRKKTRKQRKRTKVRPGYETISGSETDESGEEEDYQSQSEDLSSDDESIKSKVSSDVAIVITEASPKSEEDTAKYEATTEEMATNEDEVEDGDEDEKDDDNSSVENSSGCEDEEMEVDEGQSGHVDVIVIGGSNCKTLQKNLVGDDELLIKPNVLLEPGLKIEGTTKMIGQLSEKERKEAKIIASHVGTCNFPISDMSGLEFICQVYTEQLLTIRTHCPNAHVIISSIIPRNGNSTAVQEINEQIRQLNTRLRTFSKTEERMHFCNNYTYLVDDKLNVNSKFYKSSDRDGVHLNRDGRKALAEALGGKVRDVYQSFQGFQEIEGGYAPPTRSSEMVACMEEVVSSPPVPRHV